MDDSPASLAAAVRHDVEPAIEIDLEPVDSVTVVILMDNVTDALMTDYGPARRPAGEPGELPTTGGAALAGAGCDISEERQPSFLFGRWVLITGEVARTTGYEPGFPPQQAFLDGRWQPDPLVLDEQALVVNVRDRGLVVITGCGHAGVVNIARYARRLTGDQPLYALLGGYHLGGPLFEPLIPRVLDDLAALNPAVLVPAHCTGSRGPPSQV